MKITMKKAVEVEAKTLKIFCKVRDEFTAHIEDDKGNELGGQDVGYVPDFMPGDHYGDYVDLHVDLETGQIKNWKKPTPEQIAKFIALGGGA